VWVVKSNFAQSENVDSVSRRLFPNLGVKYPNWIMRPLDFGQWMSFFISVLTTTYVTDHLADSLYCVR